MNDPIFTRVRRIAADIFNVSDRELSQESSPETVPNWDSLNHLNFTLALETEFATQLSPEEIAEICNLQTAALLLRTKIS
jgi:acyl carrier protein